MRLLKISLTISVLSLLAACSPNRDYSDLQAFMKQEDERKGGRIEPLPPIKTVAPFSYQVGNLRSPFEPPIVVRKVDRASGPQVTPDFNRVKQYLEQFAISQLSMVGTLAQFNQNFALVRDTEGGVHRVQTGDYLGRDHGRVLTVDEASIDLIEIVPDGSGGWVERARTVALAGGA
ncbi:MAG: pilus assembly protein PilP [Pseudomonadota bacterium]